MRGGSMADAGSEGALGHEIMAGRKIMKYWRVAFIKVATAATLVPSAM